MSLTRLRIERMWERFSYKARKRLSILVLLVGMPIYIVLAVTLVDRLDRPSVLIELLIYVALGIAWIVPFKGLFKGIGQPDPDAGPGEDD